MTDLTDQLPDIVKVWIAGHTPEPAAMDAAAAELLATHSEWDSPLHYLHLLATDGDKVVPAALVGIDTAMPPQHYPSVLLPMTCKAIAEYRTEHPAAAPIVGALLMFEGFGVAIGPEGLTAEQEAAREAREFHTLPERIECAMVVGIDVGGRSFSTQKDRGTDGKPDQVRAVTEGGDGGFHDMMRRIGLLIAAMNTAPQQYLAGMVETATSVTVR